MRRFSKIGILVLLIGFAFTLQFCSGSGNGDGNGGVAGVPEGFNFYLDFSEPMDTSFPEGALVASRSPFSSTAFATVAPGEHLIFWNVGREVEFGFYRWENATRMLVNFDSVPSSIPTVNASLNPFGNAGGFASQAQGQIPKQDFQVPNTGGTSVPAISIKIQY